MSMERKEKLDVREGVGWAVLMLRSWCAVSLVRCWRADATLC
jgi:hypothetical protein